MDVLRLETTITIRMNKEELQLVVESVDRAICMINSNVNKITIGRQALLRELKPVSVEFTKILKKCML